MNKENMKKILGAFVFIVLVAGTAYYIYRDSNKRKEAVNTSTTKINNNGVGIEYSGDGNFQIEQVPVEKPNIPVPSLNRSIPKTASPELMASVVPKINEDISKLKADSDQLDLWIELGGLRKLVGDFEGAREAWEYANALSPTNYVSYSNLGALFSQDLKDNLSAEKNYLIAIKNGSNMPYVYYNVAEFYNLYVKDKAKAIDILEKGLKVNPGDKTLENTLNILKQS